MEKVYSPLCSRISQALAGFGRVLAGCGRVRQGVAGCEANQFVSVQL